MIIIKDNIQIDNINNEITKVRKYLNNSQSKWCWIDRNQQHNIFMNQLLILYIDLSIDDNNTSNKQYLKYIIDALKDIKKYTKIK